jgi:tRNA (cmo5U34)-methyltransferase
MEINEWDERAGSYDKHIRRLFPDYEVLHRLANLTISQLPDDSSVLIVGAGTGEEAARLAQLRPSYHITAIDPSAGMIEEGKRKHPDLGITWRAEPIQALDSTRFDGATLLLVLHFLPDDRSEEGKLEMLRQIARRLKPKAPLVYADLMPDPESYETHLELWRKHAYSFGADERLEKAFDYLSNEIPATSPARNQELLEAAGFEEPVTLFQEFWLRLMVTRRLSG